MRLIDADAFRKDMLNSREFNFFKTLDMQPTIKAFTLADIEEQYRKGLEKGLEERLHGEWIEHRQYYMNYFVSEYECSNCRDEVWQETEWQFCPNCGADMREGDENGTSS